MISGIVAVICKRAQSLSEKALRTPSNLAGRWCAYVDAEQVVELRGLAAHGARILLPPLALILVPAVRVPGIASNTYVAQTV